MNALAGIRPAAYSAVSFEAYALGARSRLLDPLAATSIPEAEAEIATRWNWERGDRLAVREVGEFGGDLLHIYAVRQKSRGTRVWDGHVPSIQHDRWLDHVCTIDLNVVAGIAVGLVGCEVDLHERRQKLRPDGARMVRA